MTNSKAKKNNNKALFIVLLLILLIGVSGVTYAWFTTTVSGSVEITMGDLAVELGNFTVLEPYGTNGYSYPLEPGVGVPYGSTIENTGDIPAAVLFTMLEEFEIEAEFSDADKNGDVPETWAGETASGIVDYTAGVVSDSIETFSDVIPEGYFKLNINETAISAITAGYSGNWAWFSFDTNGDSTNDVWLLVLDTEAVAPIAVDVVADGLVWNAYQASTLNINANEDGWRGSQVLPGAITALFDSAGLTSVTANLTAPEASSDNDLTWIQNLLARQISPADSSDPTSGFTIN
ncbi:MAG: hypothetical protein LBC56_00760 [Oscillospiraceae bacterium]|jgi:hypothetical protein|nr:hypothetical protein [Oscillospiraceae bacterium]